MFIKGEPKKTIDGECLDLKRFRPDKKNPYQNDPLSKISFAPEK